VAFYNVLAAKAIARITAEDLAQKERHLEEARRRQAAGTATDYDVLAADVTLQRARPLSIRAANDVVVTKEQLRFLLANSVGPIEPDGTLVVDVAPPLPFEEALFTALRNRPELAELAGLRGIYTELITIAAASGKPRVDFAGGFGTRNLALPSASATGTTWSAAVVATVPLFDGRRSAGLTMQARTDLSRATIDELKARDAVALEVRVALNAVQEASDIVAALGGGVRQAEQLLFLANKGYELGVKTQLEVQDAQLAALVARAELTRAQRDYRVARVALEWVTGTIGQ
jgi:outer membrane protein TolC